MSMCVKIQCTLAFCTFTWGKRRSFISQVLQNFFFRNASPGGFPVQGMRAAASLIDHISSDCATENRLEIIALDTPY